MNTYTLVVLAENQIDLLARVLELLLSRRYSVEHMESKTIAQGMFIHMILTVQSASPNIQKMTKEINRLIDVHWVTNTSFCSSNIKNEFPQPSIYNNTISVS